MLAALYRIILAILIAWLLWYSNCVSFINGNNRQKFWRTFELVSHSKVNKKKGKLIWNSVKTQATVDFWVEIVFCSILFSRELLPAQQFMKIAMIYLELVHLILTKSISVAKWWRTAVTSRELKPGVSEVYKFVEKVLGYDKCSQLYSASWLCAVYETWYLFEHHFRFDKYMIIILRSDHRTIDYPHSISDLKPGPSSCCRIRKRERIV